MNIYRYVPDGRHYRGMDVGYGDRFWPEGIELGSSAEQEFPKGIGGGRWWLEGNRYESTPGSTGSLADFVATTMNIVVLQSRAFQALGNFASSVNVTVDDLPAVALQLPCLDVVSVEESTFVSGPEGEPLFWNRLAFHEKSVTDDLFWISSSMPFSYVYMTEAFVQKSKSLGLTGLDYVELVWDGRPRELSYPPIRSAGSRNGYRYYLETNFIMSRAAMMGYFSNDIEPILSTALKSGLLPWAYPE